MSLSSLSSLSDHEGPMVTRRNVEKLNAFETYNDIEFRARFRVSKETVLHLDEVFGNTIKPVTKRNRALQSVDQILITLRFYATGSYQRVIGDIFHVAQPTVHRIVHRVTAKIASMKCMYINMPTAQEFVDIANEFYSIAGFPRVVGAVDCTHIKINSPGKLKFRIDRTMVQSKYSKNDDEAYINDVEDKDSPSILNMNNSFSKNNKSNNQITAQKSINENNANKQHTNYNENNLKANESQEFESKCENICTADPSAHSQLLLTEDSTQSLTNVSQNEVSKEINTETSTIELDAIENVKNEIYNITNIKEIEKDKLQIDVNEIEKIFFFTENKDGTIAEQCAHSQSLLTEDSTRSLTEISENAVNKKLNEESSEIKLDPIIDVEIKTKHDMNTKFITNIKENEINKSQRVCDSAQSMS